VEPLEAADTDAARATERADADAMTLSEGAAGADMARATERAAVDATTQLEGLGARAARDGLHGAIPLSLRGHPRRPMGLQIGHPRWLETLA
jgi:hypothetical protein